MSDDGEIRARRRGEVVGERFLSEPMGVKPEWIDFNGHLNMAYYGVLLDHGCSHGFRALGFGPEHRAATGHTTMTGDIRIRYLRELVLGDEVRCSFRLLKVGTKAFHYAQELVHSDGWVAATGETVNLHVNIAERRVAPYPAHIRARLDAMLAEHSKWAPLEWVGMPLGVRG